MMTITLREFGVLGTKSQASNNLDYGCLPQKSFDNLLHSLDRFPWLKVTLSQGELMIQVQQFVGVFEIPGGITVEVLPKIASGNPEYLRSILIKILLRSQFLPSAHANSAQLQRVNMPLMEWVYHQFLVHLKHLMQVGLQHQYHPQDIESPFIKGPIIMAKQLRQGPTKSNMFHVRPQIYTANRPENRLLKSALAQVHKNTKSPELWRLSHECLQRLEIIPASVKPEQDWKAWKDTRLMHSYREIKPWCEIILQHLLPWSQKGEWRGISWMFPMERVFERDVLNCLKKALIPQAQLKVQNNTSYLCRQNQRPMFNLKPDLLIETPQQKWVLDTKWKRLDIHRPNFGIGQGDLYQMLAYGQVCLKGRGDMVLIYPKYPGFETPIDPLCYSEHLRVFVVPFDLFSGELVLDEKHGLDLPLKRVKDSY